MKITEPRPPFRLYFFWLPGCGWCEQAKDPLAKFSFKHANEGACISVNASNGRKIENWAPKATPGYLLLINDQIANKTIGMMDLEDLEVFLKEGYEKVLGKPKKEKKKDLKKDLEKDLEEDLEEEKDLEKEIGEGSEEVISWGADDEEDDEEEEGI